MISAEVGRSVALPVTQERMRTYAMDPGASHRADFTATIEKSSSQ
jgi:hypothetical protein